MSFKIFLCLAVGVLVLPLLFGESPAKSRIIAGKVTVKGNIPQPTFIAITKDMTCCGKSKQNPRLSVCSDGGVANAVVYLESTLRPVGLKPGAFTINQTKCEYLPHVLVVPTGSDVQIRNGDPVLHNVHAYDLTAKQPDQNGFPTLFNIALPVKDQQFKKALANSGTYLLTCDSGHPWMSAYVLALQTPFFAVTDAQGRYSIANVPAGSYKVHFWHEGVALTPGSQNIAEEPYAAVKDIVIRSGQTAISNFDFSLR